MSLIAAFSFPGQSGQAGPLEVVQFAAGANSAIWQTNGGWTGGPAEFTTEADGVNYTAVAACNVLGGDPCVFLTYPTTVQYLEFGSPGTDSDGAPAPPYAWRPIVVAGDGYALDLCAAQLPDGSVQVFAVTQGQPALQTCWQANPGPPGFTPHEFNNMTEFSPTLTGLSNGNFGVRAVTLPDGRLQLWALTGTGAQQEIVTSHKETTQSGSAWSAWSPVASSGGTLQLLAGASGTVANEILIFIIDPLSGREIINNARIYLFGITESGSLVMASFTPNTTTPSPSGVVWTPVALPSGMPAGAQVIDLAVIPLTNGGIQVFILVNTGARNSPTLLYTQYLVLAHIGTREFLSYFHWSDWINLPT
jgi:hypothetical protein